MNLSFSLLCAGYCTHREKMSMRSGSWKTVKFPALFALIEHPSLGILLFDTGYAERFFEETKRFPYSLYASITPVFFNDSESAANQLTERGIDPDDVSYVIVSHFHADHIAGLRDFPKAKFLCMRKTFESIKGKKGFSAVREGVIPNLIPNDFESRAIFVDDRELVSLPPELKVFEKGYDVFGDGSIYAVDLTGHAIGQMGIYFIDLSGRSIFLCADAVWSSKAYRDAMKPHPFAYVLFPDRGKYDENFTKLNLLYKANQGMLIIPTHCTEAWEELAMMK